MNFFTSYVSPKSKRYVQDVLESGMLSDGEWVRRFEKAIEIFYNNERKVVAVNSGTSALHLALKTMGVGVGDEVIIPPLTFVATGLAVLYCGATPVFADISYDGTIDPHEVEKKITPKTKAIIAVNWAGKECDAEALSRIANLHGVKLIIDAAQSFGCKLYGDAVCFSFQAIKHLTTGDGGAVAFLREEDYEQGKRLAWFGIDRDRDVPGILGEREYNLKEVGFKYHMNNVTAAIGLGNMDGIDARLQNAKNLSRIYRIRIFSAVNEEYTWAHPIRVRNIEKFSAYCKENNVTCTNLHRGIDNNDIFAKSTLPVMRWWERNITHLPIHHELSEEDVAWICEKVNQYES